jgi:hypothetical protein
MRQATPTPQSAPSHRPDTPPFLGTAQHRPGSHAALVALRLLFALTVRTDTTLELHISKARAEQKQCKAHSTGDLQLQSVVLGAAIRV